MPALPDPTTWRRHPQYHRGYLYIDRPPLVFRARVALPLPAFPQTSFGYDNVSVGAYTDVEAGMLLVLGSVIGADDLGRARVRAIDASTISCGRVSRGTHDGELELQQDAYVQIYDDFRPWARIPYIDDEGVIYKDGVLLPASEYPPPPVVILNRGSGEADFVDPTTGVLTVSLDASGSYAVAAGAGIASYQWDVKDGTITVGTATDPAITVTFPAGRRWISCTVTDSNGQSATRKYLVVACDTGSNAPLTNFQVVSHRHRPEGQRMRFRIFDAIPAGTYLDGVPVIYWEREVFGDVLTPGAYSVGPLVSPVGHVKFFGWHHTDEARIEAGERGLLTHVAFECLDMAGKLDTLPGFPQTVERDGTPTSWLQMADLDIDRYLYYLLKWHSNALQLTDFRWSGQGGTYPISILGSSGQSLYDQVDGRAQAIAHRLTCDRLGRLWVKPDPQLQDAAARTGVVIVDLDERDWQRIDYTHVRPPRSHWLREEAVIADGTDADRVTGVGTAFAIAPGLSPGQGLTASQHGEQLVVSQDELNARAGHRYATRLNPEETYLRVRLAHGSDGGLDPAFMEWVRLTISAASAAERGLTFTDEKMLLIERSIDYDPETGTKTVELVLERYRVGVPAQTNTPGAASSATPAYTPPQSLYPVSQYTPLPESLYRLPRSVKVIAAPNADGYLYNTADYNVPAASGGPTWTRQNMGLSGTPLSFTVDAFSPLYLGSGSVVNGWIVTGYGIYRLTDLCGTVSAALQYTFSSAPDAAFIDASFGAQNWVMVATYRSGAGVHVYYTTDGTTWTEVNVTAHYNTAAYYPTPGLYISPKTPGLAYVAAFTSTGTVPSAALYRSVDYGATWAPATELVPDLQNELGGTLCVPYGHSSEQLLYYNRRTLPEASGSNRLYRTVGTVHTDLAPSEGAQTYGPRGYTYARWQIKDYPLDPNIMVMVGARETDDYVAGFVTRDGWATYTQVFGPTLWQQTYNSITISGDNADVLYLWGAAGRIGYSDNFGSTIDDRRGNMPTDFPGVGTFLGVAGGG